MSIKELMPLEKAFHLRTQSIYDSMKKRFAEKKWKTGRLAGKVRRAGRELLYTLPEFRGWLRAQFGGREDGTVSCVYCGVPLDAMNFRIDHSTPISRGGDLFLTNLAVCCDKCNREKGELNVEEFGILKNFLQELLDTGKIALAAYNDIWKRLRGQVMMFHKGKPKAKPQGPTEDNGELW